MVRVRAEYQARFREITGVGEEEVELREPRVSELAQILVQKYGPLMEALLVDPQTGELNNKGTLFLDSKGRRISMGDTLEDGEVISFMVGIAGG